MSDNKLTEFFEKQLQQWPDARQRYDDLANIRTRGLKELRLQFNPARMVSTGAKIDKQSLAKRPCFLCAAGKEGGGKGSNEGVALCAFQL